MPKPLSAIWQSGVEAVRGEPAVRAVLPTLTQPPDHIIAVGKAGCDMARPAMAAFEFAPTLIVTKHGHVGTLPRPATVIEAGHPIPDDGSLVGGAALSDAVASCATRDHLLMLVSGGASATAELLPNGMTLAEWQAETHKLIASGADIHAINTRRKQISQIKGGKLLAKFTGARVTTLAISDVEGDSLDVIGSGIGAPPAGHNFQFSAHIVASNTIARAAAASAADGPVVINQECLFEDVTTLAPRIAAKIMNGPAGISIFGGEPTVILPDAPGRGGRNQALALMIAREIAGTKGIEILVAGTDGTDGPTPDAGATVNGDTWGSGAETALLRADSGTFLNARNALFTTGPTGTNVMDMIVARKT